MMLGMHDIIFNVKQIVAGQCSAIYVVNEHVVLAAAERG